MFFEILPKYHLLAYRFLIEIYNKLESDVHLLQHMQNDNLNSIVIIKILNFHNINKKILPFHQHMQN
jgi:hypothetical protein